MQDLDSQPAASIVQDLDSQPAAVETKPPAPSALKIEMPKLDIAATSDAAEPQRSARDFSAREREVAKPALASTGVAALTARGAKDKKEAAAAAGESTAPPALSLNKLSELKGRDPDAPMATPRKDAPDSLRHKNVESLQRSSARSPSPLPPLQPPHNIDLRKNLRRGRSSETPETPSSAGVATTPLMSNVTTPDNSTADVTA